MPYLDGFGPIRRTLGYLQKGSLYFKDTVRIMMIGANSQSPSSQGTRDFKYWYVPQIQYKNPQVQIVSFKDITPSPFIKFYLDSGENVVVDTDSKEKEDILSHIIKILGKPKEVVELEQKLQEGTKKNPAHFGVKSIRHCICEVPGQAPCPGLIQYPKRLRGKFLFHDPGEE